MNDTSQFVFGVAVLGAALQELVYWYSLRKQLDKRKYKALLRSRKYWAVTILMIGFSGLGTWAWFEGAGTHTAKEFLVTGAAFPLILKKAVAAATADKPADLGELSLLREYFQ